jgi:hypothetical protein
MSPTRAKVIEQIALNTRERKLRTVAFVSTRYDHDTSVLIADVAEVTARARVKSLVVDLSGGRGATSLSQPLRLWSLVRQEAPEIGLSERGFDVVRVDMEPKARAALNDPDGVRRSLASAFPEYELIFLDLPGITDESTEYPNTIAASAACDGVILVCPTGEVTEGEINRALELVRAAGGKFRGAIMNDRSNPTIASDIKRLRSNRRGFLRLLPGWFMNWLERRQLLQAQIYS